MDRSIACLLRETVKSDDIDDVSTSEGLFTYLFHTASAPDDQGIFFLWRTHFRIQQTI